MPEDYKIESEYACYRNNKSRKLNGAQNRDVEVVMVLSS
jgi:hypothetical protein